MGLLFDLFKAEDAEVEFIVAGIERLVRPIFLARLKVLEVFADGYTGSSELSVGDRVLVGGCG